MARERTASGRASPRAPGAGEEFLSIVIIVTGVKKKQIHEFISKVFPCLTDFWSPVA